jgi:hypothetical protein
MHQQLWGYKVEEKLCVGVREQKRLNTTAIAHHSQINARSTQVESALYLIKSNSIKTH